MRTRSGGGRDVGALQRLSVSTSCDRKRFVTTDAPFPFCPTKASLSWNRSEPYYGTIVWLWLPRKANESADLSIRRQAGRVSTSRFHHPTRTPFLAVILHCHIPVLPYARPLRLDTAARLLGDHRRTAGSAKCEPVDLPTWHAIKKHSPTLATPVSRRFVLPDGEFLEQEPGGEQPVSWT